MKKHLKALLVFVLVVALSFGGSISLFAKDEIGAYEAEPGYLQLEKMTPTSVSVGWGDLMINTGLDGFSLNLMKTEDTSVAYSEGICAHAAADISYNLEGYGATKLEFFYGINNQKEDNLRTGSCVFKVYIDGVELLNDNSIHRIRQIQSFASIAIPAGAKVLRLVVTDGGDGINCDHAVFAEPKLYVADKSLVLLSLNAAKTVAVDEQIKITPNANLLDGTAVAVDVANCTFTSGNEGIATVDNKGTVTGVSAGTATITCNAAVNGNNVSAKIDVSVIAYAKTWTIASPGTNSIVKVMLTEQGALLYYVMQDGKRVVELSPIGMNTNRGDFSTGLIYVGEKSLVVDEKYNMISGKASTYVNHANETTLSFAKSNMTFEVVFRAYDDGVAYRYNIARTDGSNQSITFTSETSAFVAPDNSTVTAMANGSGSTFSHEGTYSQKKVEVVGGKQTLPLLYETPDNSWVLINEAALTGEYCGSVLELTGSKMKLAFPQQQTASVISTTPFQSPWRYAVTGTLKNVIENTMAENLSPAPEGDFSWVKPGVSAWTWEVGLKSMQRDEEAIKKYVDFAQEMGWTYFILDEGWQPDAPSGSGVSYSGYFPWFKDLIQYAADRGVGFIAWVRCDDLNTQAKRDERLAEWAEMGIKGIKVDFFDKETQDRLKLYDDIYKECTNLHMVVNCHGANKPTGQIRTYPNLLTREAIRGEEANNNLKDQTTMTPYTRGAVGPTDFTPRIYPVSGSNTTTGQQLALNILLESGIPCMADSVENYQRSPGYSFLKNMPAAWDETLFIDGRPGEFTAIARRSGDKWYAAANNNLGTRNVVFPMSFLDEGVTYRAEIYRDGATKDDMILEVREVTKESTITVSIPTGGGCSLKIVKPVVFEKIELPENISVEQYQSYKLLPVTVPSSYEPSDIIWSSTNESVATVSSAGLVKMLKPGNATITATSAKNPDVKGECIVRVTLKTGFVVGDSWTVLRNNAKLVLNSPTSITVNSELGDFGPNDTAKNVLIRSAKDKDFEISVKVTGVPTMNYQSFAITARLGDGAKDIVSVIRRYHGNFGGNIFQMFAYNNTPNQYTEMYKSDTFTKTNPTCYLKLKKAGTQFTGYYSFDNQNWTQISDPIAQGNISGAANAEDINIGIYATNSDTSASADKPVAVTFEDFTYNGVIIPFAQLNEDYVMETEALPDVTVENGTPFSEIALPATISASLATGAVKGVAVVWDGAAYDSKIAGTYKIEGTLTMADGLKNDNNVKAVINVIVKPAVFEEGFFADCSVDELTQSLIKVNVGIKNFQTKDQPTNAILALYNDGKLVACNTITHTLGAGAVTAFDITIADLKIDSKYTAKVFVWDENYIPLTKACNVDMTFTD